MTAKKRPQRIIGIDIGSTSIKMVEVSLTERPTLVKWSSFPNPVPELFLNETTGSALVKPLKKCRRILSTSTRISSLCLADPALIVKEMSLPSMGQKELIENVRLNCQSIFRLT